MTADDFTYDHDEGRTVPADPPKGFASMAAAWMNGAPVALAAMIRRMTFHRDVNWNAPDYITDDDFKNGDPRRVTENLDEAEALSSLTPYPLACEGDRWHFLAVDIDVAAWLIPSSTPGHAHLYSPLPMLEEDYFAWLDASVVIGLLEPGYVSACKSRGMTSLRAPWIRKGEERPAPAAPEVKEPVIDLSGHIAIDGRPVF